MSATERERLVRGAEQWVEEVERKKEEVGDQWTDEVQQATGEFMDLGVEIIRALAARLEGEGGKESCPTCGGPVRIGGDGSTHYYVPNREGGEVVAWAGELQAESGAWVTQSDGPWRTPERAQRWRQNMIQEGGWPKQHVRIVALVRRREGEGDEE